MAILTRKTVTKPTVLEQVKAAHAQAVEEEQLVTGEIAILEEQLEIAKRTSAEMAKLVAALGGIVGTD